VLKPTPDVHTPYFQHVFKSSNYIKALQSTADFIRDGQDLNFGNFCAVDLPFPPYDEQQRIAAFVNTQVAGIDASLNAASIEAALLTEYRDRVIADVVTGKLDVREAAAHLPQEIADITDLEEPLDEATDEDTDPAEEGEALE
jgi:type I restriction enzyme S subunit